MNDDGDDDDDDDDGNGSEIFDDDRSLKDFKISYKSDKSKLFSAFVDTNCWFSAFTLKRKVI